MSSMDMKSLIAKMDSIEDFNDKHEFEDMMSDDDDDMMFDDDDDMMPDMDDPRIKDCEMCGGDHSLDEECAVEEGFEDATTEPDPEYSDTKYITKDLAGGLNKEKGSYDPSAGADNPMALEDDELLENKIRAELKALYKL